MTRSSTGYTLFTPEQELLLQAALLNGSAGLEAWKRWKSRVDFERLDAGSQRLLPQLYKNLRDQAVNDPLMGRLQGFYRMTWYKNQALIHEMEATLRAFQDTGIRTMLLKGAALSLHYYEDYGLRSMSDFDVDVAEQDIGQAVSVLQELGWQDKAQNQGPSLEYRLAVFHSVRYSNNHSEFDLHSGIGFTFWQNGLSNAWKDAIPIRLNGIETLVMHPAEMLIDICVRGLAWNPVPSVCWIADAMAVLRAEPTLDWERVTTHTKEAHLALPVYTALGYLRSLLAVDIPSSVLLELASAPISPVDRFRMSLALSPHAAPARILRHYDGYTRVRKRENVPQSLSGFLRYLQQMWGLKHVWQTPFQGAKRIRRVLRGTFV